MKILFNLLVWSALMSCSAAAQLVITDGGFEAKLPSAEWKLMQPPAALRDMISKQPGGKMLFFAESPFGRFFVSQFEYPAIADQAAFVGGFIAGVRNSSAKSGAKIEERFGTFPGTQCPTYTFERPVNANFLNTTAIFCATRVYNVQIVAAESARAEAMKCLDGVKVHEAPMDAQTFKRGTQPNAVARSVAYDVGRRLGMLAALLAGVVIVFGLIFGAAKLFSGGKSSAAMAKPSVPPRLPPQPPTTS